MSVIEFAESRIQEIKENIEIAHRNGQFKLCKAEQIDLRYWLSYLDGAKAYKRDSEKLNRIETYGDCIRNATNEELDRFLSYICDGYYAPYGGDWLSWLNEKAAKNQADAQYGFYVKTGD